MDPERDIGSTPQGAIPKPFINIKFHGSPFANGGRGNLWPNCRVEVPGKTEGNAYAYGPGYGYYGGPDYGYYGGYGPTYYGGYAPAYYDYGYAPAYRGYRYRW